MCSSRSRSESSSYNRAIDVAEKQRAVSDNESVLDEATGGGKCISNKSISEVAVVVPKRTDAAEVISCSRYGRSSSRSRCSKSKDCKRQL
jgi:hypothetical protein